MKDSREPTPLSKTLSKKRELASLCDDVIERELARGRLKRPGSMRNLRRWLRREVVKREGMPSSGNGRRLMKAAAVLLMLSGLLLSGGPTGVEEAEAARTFTRKTHAEYPFTGLAVTSLAAPVAVDIDSDGKIDVFVGDFNDGTIKYYKNTGTAGSPAFTELTGTDNPLNEVNVLKGSGPTFADIDKDGDMDAFVGEKYGTVKYYENTDPTFEKTDPTFVERTGTDNPLNVVATNGYAKPVFADIDNDGDLDAFVGEQSGQVRYYENTETGFSSRTGALNPLNGFDVGTEAAPAFMDMDSNGVLDAILGGSDGTLRYYENRGSAESPVFTERTGYLNPLNDVDTVWLSTPTFGDMDDDGDMDLIVGWPSGTLEYRENSPAIVNDTFTELYGPLDGFDVGYNSSPTFADIDNDGDLDAFVGGYGGGFKYYENTGSAQTPAFVARAGASNPLDGFVVAGYERNDSTPTFADIDSDGDLDAFAGNYNGTVHYYENTGSAESPAFTELTGTDNPLDGVGGYFSQPTFADLDADGDLDAFVGGARNNKVHYYENTGSALNPAFVERTGGSNPLDGFDAGSRSAPTFADIDKDGDLDVFLGEFYGTIKYYENTGSAANPAFVERAGASNPLNGFDVGWYGYSTPAFADIDADGDLDAFVGEENGTINFYRNDTPAASTPSFSEKTGANNPLNGFNVGAYSTPTFVDIDSDGDLDAFVGEYDGTSINYYENNGSTETPAFVAQTGTANPLNGVSPSIHTSPIFTDIDSDGDLDLFIGTDDLSLYYYENTGSAVVPAFVQRTGAAHPLWSSTTGNYGRVAFVDIDSDGDLDLFSGNSDGTGIIKYFENTGSALTPVFTEHTGAQNPMSGFNVGWNVDPYFMDMDSDGDLDAFVGERSGTVKCYENTGSAESPAFVERTGTANPFNGFVLGPWAAPSFADIDADGDLDAFIGEGPGTIKYFENNSAPRFASPPAISGTAEVGEVLSLTGTETYDPEGDTVTLSYQWKADGFDITGAISDTYTLTADETAKSLTCTVTVDDGNGGITSATTAGVIINAAGNRAPTFDGSPAISGTSEVGEILSLTETATTDLDGDTVALGYQWKADAVDIDGAISATYTLTSDESATAVTCTVTADDGNGGITPVTTSGVTVADVIAPVISLSGGSPLNVEAGAAYSDAGATAIDNADGDITANIVMVNPVDTSILGSYTVTYNVSDANHNFASEVTRTVTVQDTTAPVIVLTGSSSVTVETGSNYSDEGATADDNLDGDISAAIVTTNPVDTSTVGSYTVTYNVTDANDNAAVEVTRTVTVIIADSDSDTMDDNWEIANFGDTSALASDDPDGDGLTNLEEYRLSTDPNADNSLLADVDGNKIPDSWESAFSPMSLDPLADDDGDGITNIREYFHATDPTRDNSDAGVMADTDGDGIPDDVELANGTDPDVSDATADPDGDGLTNMEEYYIGSGANEDNRMMTDTDGDGIPDLVEIAAGLDPDVDSSASYVDYMNGMLGMSTASGDGDTIPDLWEIANGLDAGLDNNATDKDGDGIDDVGEYALGLSPIDSNQPPVQVTVTTADGAEFPTSGGVTITFNATTDPEGMSLTYYATLYEGLDMSGTELEVNVVVTPGSGYTPGVGLAADSIYTVVIWANDSYADSPITLTRFVVSDGTLAGDISYDGKVDGYDLILLSVIFGKSIGDPEFNPFADIDGSGTIDGSDLAILSNNFGKVRN